MERRISQDEVVFHNAQSYFTTMLEEIAVAKDCVLLEFYTIEEDNLGQELASALIAAAHRGVKVFMITDGIGSKRISKDYVLRLEKAGVQFEFFNRLASQVDFRLGAKFGFFEKVTIFLRTYLLLKINKRDHRKVCVIDDQVAFVGSANISDVHVRSNSFGPSWRDTGFRISDERVKILKETFDLTWQLIRKKGRVKRFIRRTNIVTNFTPISRRKNLSGLKRRIAIAKRRVWITNPYFVPTPCIVKELIKAKRRGVEVCLLTGQRSDHKFFPWINSVFYRPLIKAGIQVYLYQPSVLHSKVTIIDDRAISGSSNLNHRSLFHDLELDLYIRNTKTVEKLSSQYKVDLINSFQVLAESANNKVKATDLLIPFFWLIKGYF